ncbi:hypothetical protein OH491_07305 [Termitidicoccus mucosus]|uniref:hypothetical protein n=1 Tax=Termitidicoccus mucosus TaxID=1184151 RepID=UPI0011AB35B6
MDKINIVIGYDARKPLSYLKSLWPSERRMSYLLSESCLIPLSIDFLAWPSIFDNNHIGVGLPSDHKKQLGMGTIPMPTWVGPYYPFWEDAAEIIKYANMHDGNWVLIKVEKSSKRGDEQVVTSNIRMNDEIQWLFCGFDVADEGFTSSVTNFNSPLIPSKIKHDISRILNENGLFASISDALAWADIVNRKVPEMPSQFIYKLYMAICKGEAYS